jgi:ATP-binding cassette, subfamily F, member 3
MIVLQVNGLSKSFGADLILSNIKLEVQSKDRIAIVGRNGAGKSTLLKTISGQLSYDEGEIMIPNDTEMGYLAQHTGLESDRSIWDEMMTVFEPLKKMEAKLRTLEEKMGDPDLLANPSQYEKLLKEYDGLQITFKDKGGYQYEADIRSVLHGLQFQNFDYNTPISTLSGGQKTRLALGKLLLTKPDLLILDEPTNHLDIATLSWLENYLQSYPGAILIVSHDRYFLDKVVNIVYEISRTKSIKFHGNYSSYLDEKAKRFEIELKEYEKQQSEVAKMKDFIQKNIARASTTKRAQSKRKQLEKMTLVDKPQGDEKSAVVSFDIERQSGNDVLRVRDLTVSYEKEKPIFSNLQFELTRGESVAIVGPNGAGKSTFLKAIIKQITQQQGTINYGTNVKIGFYDQEQANLSSNKTVVNELWDDYPLMKEKDIRSILGSFLFSGDDVFKPVSGLSGGEKARLALAKLMLQKANVLILDEPTNHLDLDSKEILEGALIDYPGTILFVSHDRYFINRIATRVVELANNEFTNYLGDYDYFLEKKAEMDAVEALKQAQKQASEELGSDKKRYEQDKETKRLERQRNRRIEEIEQKVEELEETVLEKETLLADPAVYEDYEKVQELNESIKAMQQEIETLMEEWEELQT